MRGPLRENLLASSVAERARALSRAEFVTAVGAPILLVAVESASSELAMTLQTMEAGAKVPLVPSMSFRTRSPDPDAPRVRRSEAPLTSAKLEARIARAPQVAIALRKRFGAAKDFSDRISVGRALNNDVVLRHERVSKFHAWFECDEEDGYYVADAASRNGTSLNGEPVGDTLTPLHVGDTLRFGGVEAVVCSAEVFWHAAAG
jgi:hypothetical protein